MHLSSAMRHLCHDVSHVRNVRITAALPNACIMSCTCAFQIYVQDRVFNSVIYCHIYLFYGHHRVILSHPDPSREISFGAAERRVERASVIVCPNDQALKPPSEEIVSVFGFVGSLGGERRREEKVERRSFVRFSSLTASHTLQIGLGARCGGSPVNSGTPWRFSHNLSQVP